MKIRSVSTLTLATAFALAFSTVLPAAAQEGNSAVTRKADQRANSIYIVQMADPPAVAYAGGIAGYKATRPNKGQKIDPNDRAVLDYAGYLDARHDAALVAAGGGRKVYGYHYSFNGFAAELTDAQAARMAGVSGVLAVSKDELRDMDTSSTPTFLGLDAPGGLWDQLGGTGKAGDGIIIGVVDSGIWPESLSFSDRIGTNGNATKDGKLDYYQIPGWHGRCTPGEDFNVSMCNQKLIGGQWFNAAWGGNAGIDALRPWEFNSVRDYNGHGTHTSSTAGGNNGVQATGPAAALGKISGMAPHARIAMYKALWSTQDASTASGFTSDLVAAIDQAVADGVDVINYSISGTSTNFLEPVQVAFLNASYAGVFVAASAGNSGPTTSTVAHPGPWLTTVAAGTHNRNGEGSVTINGTTYTGASFASAITGPLVDAENSGVAGADVVSARQCFAAIDNLVGGIPTPVLDPAKVAGKIVLCDRGSNALVNKSLAVKEAGGIGMVLTNVSGGATTTLALIHSVPTVHVAYTAGNYAALHAAADAGATAAIAQATIVFNVPAPATASFSSRGPLRASGDLLKPDLIAPGQDILAAVAPPGNGGLDFNLYSGTSMSSPHVAGLAALLKDLHPDWTPMMIKSALMTTGYDVIDPGISDATRIFRQGAGHVKPNSAVDPGLVYDAGLNDWLAFLCGTTTGVSSSTCSALAGMGYSTDPSNLNVASIAIGDLTSVQTVTRKVTNVGDGTATYTASYTGMAGFTVSITPSSLTLTRGETKSFTVTFARTTAPFNAYTGGQLTWSDGTHNVRIPMVVRPLALVAPTQVSGSGGAINYNVTFGYTGPFTATARGLIPAAITSGTVTQDPDQTFDPSSSSGTVAIPVTIPAGTSYTRFALFDADAAPGSDIDLYVYQGTTLIGSSTNSGSNEEVNFTFATPTAAAIPLTVYLHGFTVPSGSSPFALHAWYLGTANAGNMTVSAPASATLGTTGTIGLTFSGLAPATRYLGSVAYSGIAGLPNPTIVRVDTP
ncbi:MAG: S8 family peptidase [Acidobacteriota bacterium]